MKKEVMAMQNARAQRADERNEDTPFRRWSAVCILAAGFGRSGDRPGKKIQKNFKFSDRSIVNVDEKRWPT